MAGNTMDPEGALAVALRTQIMDRVRAQEQLVVTSAAIGGAAASFGSEFLSQYPEVIAFLAVLFATLLLAMVRHEHEITIIASHLEDEAAFGEHAAAQRRWERHKFLAMQRTDAGNRVLTAVQAVGIYGIPFLAYLACVLSALVTGWSEWVTIATLTLSAGLIVLCGFAIRDVFIRYQKLGQPPSQPE